MVAPRRLPHVGAESYQQSPEVSLAPITRDLSGGYEMKKTEVCTHWRFHRTNDGGNEKRKTRYLVHET
jgi:hypothetical protein